MQRRALPRLVGIPTVFSGSPVSCFLIFVGAQPRLRQALLRPSCAADLELTRSAAELRAEHKLPDPDGFTAALATSDKDFASVEKKLDLLWTTEP
jgi:hypothetical protein